MDISFHYSKPIARYQRAVSLPDWFLSTDYYDKGNYQMSVVHLLKYINPPIPVPDGPDLNITIPHGSVNVTIKLTKEKFSLKVPFLKLTATSQKLPALRQMIEKNFSTLVLGQITMKGDELVFEYEAKTADCEPYKIYSLLDEICYEADNNDDYYIDRFKLEALSVPNLNYFSPTELKQGIDEFKSIINECLQHAEESEAKRFYGMACDALAIAFFRIRYSIFPQGIFGRDVQDAFNGMFTNEAPELIISKTKDKLKKLLSYDEAKIKESLFHPIFLMPIKKRAEIPFIQDKFSGPFKTVSDSFQGKSYQYAATFGIYELYNMMDLYTIPAEVQKGIEYTLEKSSGKDWKTTAELVNAFFTKLMEIQFDENGNIVRGSLDFDNSSSSSSGFKSIFSKITNVFK
ncbi:MAG: hypothetical protein SFU98_09550 [Leptospiraceae bacterium]|nr:hypothetical protein [Leptospiraceae bacterium]